NPSTKTPPPCAESCSTRRVRAATASPACLAASGREPFPPARFLCRQPLIDSVIILIGGWSPVSSTLPSAAKLMRSTVKFLLRRLAAATRSLNESSIDPRAALLSGPDAARVISSSDRHKNPFIREYASSNLPSHSDSSFAVHPPSISMWLTAVLESLAGSAPALTASAIANE